MNQVRICWNSLYWEYLLSPVQEANYGYIGSVKMLAIYTIDDQSSHYKSIDEKYEFYGFA